MKDAYEATELKKYLVTAHTHNSVMMRAGMPKR